MVLNKLNYDRVTKMKYFLFIQWCSDDGEKKRETSLSNCRSLICGSNH
jgi:hypothetical protein